MCGLVMLLVAVALLTARTMRITSRALLPATLSLLGLCCTRLLGCLCLPLGSCGLESIVCVSSVRCSCNCGTRRGWFSSLSQPFIFACSSAKSQCWIACSLGLWTLLFTFEGWSSLQLMMCFMARCSVPRHPRKACWYVFGRCWYCLNWQEFTLINR